MSNHRTATRTGAGSAASPAVPAEPAAARLVLDFLRSRTTGPAAQDGFRAVTELDDLDDDDFDAELADRLEEMYAAALPRRLSAIAAEARAGDAAGLAGAAAELAGTSGQLGHPAVAEVCRAIAADARRGVLAHARLAELQALARD
jgi:hypothetical protein